ncbi:ComEC/Rec2 family competence protein [Oscillibacter sp. GMB15532]|uniref:ComEC/Rec2 family competence protein n=1 Tax=Oscillibacter sp. GMB15532 TaxID=3230022 RepID=UPI0034DED78D
MTVIKKVGFSLRLLLFLAVLVGAFGLVWQANAAPSEDGPAEIFFLSTQNEANCTLIRQGDAVILVDTGEAVDGPAIVEFLREKDVSRIDYLILTHPDQDHIGGAPAVLAEFSVGTVIQPYYTKENDKAEALEDIFAELDVKPLSPTRPRSFTCGGLRMTVYPPLERQYRKDNNYSLAVLVRHGEINMLFPGDAEEKRLGELLRVHWPEVQLYEVARHGRASPSSGALIERLNPQYAVSPSKGSDSAIREACNRVGAELLYTMDGTLHFSSDGTALTRLYPEDKEQPYADT